MLTCGFCKLAHALKAQVLVSAGAGLHARAELPAAEAHLVLPLLVAHEGAGGGEAAGDARGRVVAGLEK